jgi:hypothetical protein
VRDGQPQIDGSHEFEFTVGSSRGDLDEEKRHFRAEVQKNKNWNRSLRKRDWTRIQRQIRIQIMGIVDSYLHNREYENNT